MGSQAGYQDTPLKDSQYAIFVHPFDRMRDALYISLDKWDDFLYEPEYLQYQPDLVERRIQIQSNLTRITVPEALLRSEVATLPEMFRSFFNVKVLFIVVAAQPDLHSADFDSKVQWR